MKSHSDCPFKKSDIIGRSLFVIAGPCVIESEKICLHIAEKISELSQKHSLTLIFKASYDKANRTSIASYRGPGKAKGLKILQKVKDTTGLPVCTDIHTPDQAKEASAVADILQIPAFLCRQTDLLTQAAATGKYVNVKKGQFMAPADMRYAIEKAGPKCLVTERGTFFGYNNLVFDVRSIPTMKRWGFPVVIDASHIVQRPGGRGAASGGEAEFIPLMVRTGVAAGADGLFLEVHDDPAKALSDGLNSLILNKLEEVLRSALRIKKAVLESEAAAR